jgi:hypothetical protein
MAIIKKFSPFQNLTNFETFINDTTFNSEYFRISQLSETFTGGKNGFLIEGSPFLKETTDIKIEILDVEGNPLFFEPGNGIPEYYEGNSKLVAVHVYDDTPIGIGKITILGELKEYVTNTGATKKVPSQWRDVYNVKFEQPIQINRTLSNENIVRFYKRPLVNITELVKPIFSKSIPTKTETGYVHGVPEIPTTGTNLSNWRAGTTYKLIRTSGSWDRDVDENTITLTNPTHTGKIIEVLNQKEVLIDTPYVSSSLVDGFVSASYSVSYTDFQNEVIGESTLTGSFAKIDITQLKTFVGDVARVKVFRKSRNSVGDFEFVQESKLESSELLRDVTTPSDTEIPYGRFDESNLSNYWVTSSTDHGVGIDSSILSQAVKIDYNNTAGGTQQLITSQSLSISKDVEYTINFKTVLSGSLDDVDKNVRVFLSSSNFTQDFTTISGSAIYRTRQDITQNIISENTGDAKLVFEVKGDDWYISNVSLKNAQETSFSPDEFTLIQDIPRKLQSETFDFNFEFYDINNNFIPVTVNAVGVFDGGNDFPTSGKLFTFESDRNAFRFSSGSIANPYNQTIQFKTTQNNLTGSSTFQSSAFDVDGNYLNPSNYSQYPGLLTNVTTAGGLLTLSNFTGSYSGAGVAPYVGSVVYTASLENLQEFETVYRLEDGDNAPQLIVTSNANQFTYEPTELDPKPAGQSITIRAQRKNLASLVTTLTVNSGSNRPELTYVDTQGGIDTFTLSAQAFSQSFSQNSFDDVTYSFTGSDVFGNEQSDEITISKLINFDGVSITLTNEATSYRANSQGLILDDLTSGDGEVEMRIANKEISHSDGLSSPNRFDIISATATNVTEAYSSYSTNEFGISAMSQDSGSLLLNIKYLAGDSTTSQSFQKKVNYTKTRIASPSITFDTTNKTQNVDAKSTGVQLSSFDNSTITIREFYTGSVNTFSTSDISLAITSGSDDVNGNPLITRNNLVLSVGTLPNGTNSTQIGLTATVTDSEGTSREVSDTISLSKTNASAPNVEILGFPSAQGLKANSLGSGSATPSSISLVVSEGGVTRTITGIGTITTTGGLSVVTPTSPFTTISFDNDASDMTSDDGLVTIPVQTTNSEGTSITKNVVIGVSRIREGAAPVFVKISPSAQTINADSRGSGSTSPTTIEVGATQRGFGDVFTDIGDPTYSGGITGSISSNTITFTDTASDMTSDTETIEIPINFLTKEGTSTTETVTAVISRVRIAVPNVEIFVTPQSQTINANSVGSGSDVPSSLRIDAREGGTNRFTSFGSITFTGGLTGSGDNSTKLFTFTSDASDMTSDTGTVSIPVNFTDGEGTTGTKTIEATVSRVRLAQPNTNFSVTPAAQTIAANSDGTLTGTIQDVRIDGFDGNTALTYNQGTLTSGQYKITNVTGVTVGDTTPSTSTIDITSFSGDSVTGTASIAFKDNEGTDGTTTIKFTLSKSKKATPTTIISANPQAQTVDSNSDFSTVGTPSAVSIIVNEGGSDYGYDTGGAIAKNKFRITGVTNGSNNNDGTITPTTPSDGDGTTSVVTLSYTNSEGTEITGKTITVNVGVAVQGDDGAKGDDGKRTLNGRIFYSVTATSAPSTPSATSYTFSTNAFADLTSNWSTSSPTFEAGNSNKYWVSTFQAVETTAGGGTAVPTFGTPTQAINFTGIVTFSGAGGEITDGTNVLQNIPSSSIANHIGGANTTTIDGGKVSTGIITSTGYATTNPDDGEYTLGGTIFNLNDGSLRSKNFYINSGGDAFFSGSLAAATGTFSGNLSAAGGSFEGSLSVGSSNDILKVDTSGNLQIGHATFASAPFRVTKGGAVTATNITATGGRVGPLVMDDNMIYIGTGTFGNANTQFFAGTDDAAEIFSLGNKLTWDGTTLNISGNVVITGGSTATAISNAAASASAAQSDAGNAAASASAAQSDADTANSKADAINATTSSLENPSSYSFGGNGFTLATNNASAGLNLTSEFLGYHNGTEFKSYMANNGDFYLGGTSGALTWDHSTSTLNVNRVTATTGSIGAWKIDSDSLFAGTKGSSGNFTSAGGITIGSTGFISANGFYIDTAGNFVQDTSKSKLSGGTNIRPFGDIFDVDSDALVIKSDAKLGSGTSRAAFSNAFKFDDDGNFRLNEGLPVFGSTTGIGTRFSNIATNFTTINSYDSTIFDGNCVLPGTKIITHRGEINVEHTKEDDLIKIFNFETKEWGWSSIDEIITNKVQGWSKIETELGKKLKCSNSHLLYHPDYPNCEISVDKLGVGGELYVYDGERLVIDKIKSIESFDDEVEVWNYELDVVHNYISDGILSHNMAAKLQPAATFGHPYKKRISESISTGDLVKLDSNNELIKVSSAKDTAVVGILWEKYELKIINLITGSVEDGYAPYSPSEELVSASYLDSFGNYLPNNETGSKEIWRVAALGDSIEYNKSEASYTLTGFKMCNQGGDVVPGDLLCSSDTPGYLMKQPSEWVVTGFNGDTTPIYEERQTQCSYTVAKSMESSSWDSNGRMEDVYGYLYCG